MRIFSGIISGFMASLLSFTVAAVEPESFTYDNIAKSFDESGNPVSLESPMTKRIYGDLIRARDAKDKPYNPEEWQELVKRLSLLAESVGANAAFFEKYHLGQQIAAVNYAANLDYALRSIDTNAVYHTGKSPQMRQSAARATTPFFVKNLFSNQPEVAKKAELALSNQNFNKIDFLTVCDDAAIEKLRLYIRNSDMIGDIDASVGSYIPCNLITVLGHTKRDDVTIALLKELQGKRENYERSIFAALVWQGDKESVEKLKALYRQTSDLSAKSRYAHIMGESSDIELLKILATDLRNPDCFEGGPGFNQLVLSSLARHQEWPDNYPRGFRSRYNAEDFEKAEKWCTEKFGTTWDVPRPPVRKTPRTVYYDDGSVKVD